MATAIITGYDNEDIVRPFSLTTGDVSSPVPLDLTGYEIESDIVDGKTEAVVLRMTSNENDHLITIVDAANGLFTITINHGTIPYNPKQTLNCDFLLKKTADGTFRRLFGGAVAILDGFTTPA